MLQEYASFSAHINGLGVHKVEQDVSGMVNIHLSNLYFVMTAEHARTLANLIFKALEPKTCPECGKVK